MMACILLTVVPKSGVLSLGATAHKIHDLMIAKCCQYAVLFLKFYYGMALKGNLTSYLEGVK